MLKKRRPKEQPSSGQATDPWCDLCSRSDLSPMFPAAPQSSAAGRLCPSRLGPEVRTDQSRSAVWRGVPDHCNFKAADRIRALTFWATAMRLLHSDPVAIALCNAITTGDLPALDGLLRADHMLARATIDSTRPDGNTESRSLLHVVTDWPGHFPNGPESVRTLVAHGADVNARFGGWHTETPLHWAASSDDVAVLDALLDAGADIEADGAVIAGGTALADAVAFGQWRAARRLVERGATATLWQAAALGLLDRVVAYIEDASPPSKEEVTNAFWCACHGGQLATAMYLRQYGADLNWLGYDGLTPLDAARRAGAEDVASWLVDAGGVSGRTTT